MFSRRQTKKIRVADFAIGGGAPISIQSMTNTDTRDINATVAQIRALEEAGCEIVRLAVKDAAAADAIKAIKALVKVPLVADIHFDYRLAIAALENGIDKLRINPGNIGSADRVEKVVAKAKEYGVPIRIGVNGGSLEKHLLEKYGGAAADALVESALSHIKILEDLDYDNIAVSLKSSDIATTVDAYEKIAEKVDYPLHVGVTETGTVYAGAIKSAAGIGAVLLRGIGDTIRVSLTGDPTEEVRCAKEILKALELRNFGVRFISCPTCGRTEFDLIKVAEEVESALAKMNKDIKVAVMGCAVNGPGEARDADIGIAGGKGEALLFKKGEIIRKIPEDRLVSELLMEIENM